MPGLFGRGWLPVVDFYVENVIVVGLPGKGGFVYLDQNELVNKKYAAIQKSVDANKDFILDLRMRTNEIFGALFFACSKIEEENLPLLSVDELACLYREYMNAVLGSPLITVQVYGIEALIYPDYKITSVLKQKMQSLGRDSELEKLKEILLTNDGETVAFSERKDFYRVSTALDTPKIKKIFEKVPSEIVQSLVDYPEIKSLIDTHIKKYHWVNTEYLGTSWSIERWISLFKDALLSSPRPPAEQLKELEIMFDSAQAAKRNLIKELGLPQDVIHSIDVLGEFLAQRDWTKGYFARSLPSLHKLLNEIGKRMKMDFKDILNLSYLEIFDYLKSGKVPSVRDIKQRKEAGYAFRVANGTLSLFSGDKHIKQILREEKIENPLDEVPKVAEIKGLTASLGNVRGRVRVIDSASKIPEFLDGEILVTYMTTIEFTPLFRKAIAVITDEGGMSCHAAIVSREFKLPCIVGTKIGTRALKTGDMVEVDANKGIIKII